MYFLRNLTPEQRHEILKQRRLRGRPYHHPPHRYSEQSKTYLFTAACYEHHDHIGYTAERMTGFESTLLESFESARPVVHAWCLLPNHYHLLVTLNNARVFSKLLGQLHGRTSFQWNREEGTPGRQVWCNYEDREMRSDAHYWATLNYIHNNPVKHGYARRWQDWPWSSALSYLEEAGREFAAAIWGKYPVDRYGEKWDT
jgi:putative transposase